MYKYNYLSEAINCINCVYRDLLASVGSGRAVDLSVSCGPTRHWINCGY